MNDPYDLILEAPALHAQVTFAGTCCGPDRLLNAADRGSLHFLRAGRAVVLSPPATPLAVDEPSLVFFPGAHRHTLQPAAGETAIELVCALLDFNPALRRVLALSFPPMVLLPLTRLEGIRHTLEALFAEAQSEAPGSRQLADKLCGIVLAYLARHVYEQGQQQAVAGGLLAALADRRIAAAVSAIHSRFHDPLNLDMLARDAGMSRSRFVERFSRVVGTSPHNYLVNYRIGVAQRMLASKLPVKTVASRVGYGTTSAFVRSFKQVVGVSPGSWAR